MRIPRRTPIKDLRRIAVIKHENFTYLMPDQRGANVSHRCHAIGNYLGKPIFESIEVQDEPYVFDRIARYEDDGFPLDRLSENELLVEPGLIYRQKD